MDKIVIIGSGASAVHFALGVLHKGYEVIMLDVGYQPKETVYEEGSFTDLKKNLSDPVEYFLGKNFEAVIYPDFEDIYYGFPPNKSYVFKEVPGFKHLSNGFKPIISFARGGLAEAWTAGAYPLNDEELYNFPFSFNDIAPYYGEVARRIGINGEKDDLLRFFPFHDGLMPPLDIDEHSKKILHKYEDNKAYLNSKFGVYIGRSRVATLSTDYEKRSACDFSGRCQWGCPSRSLYIPSLTLEDCKAFTNFKYLSGMYATHFDFDASRRITAVIAESLKNWTSHKFHLDKLVLAAGTLSSSKIFMDSIFKKTGEIVTLRGLMDNRQIWVPFVNLNLIGHQYNPQSYQYHQLAIGIESKDQKTYVHGQITTLKTALMHPIIQSFPIDLKSAIFMVGKMHAALGVVNVNFHDIRRQENILTIEENDIHAHSTLVINYRPRINEKNLIKEQLSVLRKALLRIGCIAPPWMHETRPMGASVHYAGTLPMSEREDIFTTSAFGQSHAFTNLFIVDGSIMPFLPAKNLTLTLMANAARIADCAF